MESIPYLKTQFHRMNAEQRSFVDRVSSLPEGYAPTKAEEERIVQIYLWLHIDDGSIAHRRFGGGAPKPEKKGKASKKQLKQKKAAAKAPRWIRDIATTKFDPHGERQHKDQKLGTFGAASEVRRIDPAEYLKMKAGGSTS